MQPAARRAAAQPYSLSTRASSRSLTAPAQESVAFELRSQPTYASAVPLPDPAKVQPYRPFALASCNSRCVPTHAQCKAGNAKTSALPAFVLLDSPGADGTRIAVVVQFNSLLLRAPFVTLERLYSVDFSDFYTRYDFDFSASKCQLFGAVCNPAGIPPVCPGRSTRRTRPHVDVAKTCNEISPLQTDIPSACSAQATSTSRPGEF